MATLKLVFVGRKQYICVGRVGKYLNVFRKEVNHETMLQWVISFAKNEWHATDGMVITCEGDKRTYSTT